MALSISDLPAVNAALNGTCVAFLVAGYISIRSKRIALHRALMLSAFVASGLFLTSYLYYHSQVGSVRFPGEGWIRPVYFSILISHSILAAAILPMALLTLYRALKGTFDRHRRIARWTLPIWLYVSVTGIVVYVMLYHLYPPALLAY